MATVDIVAILEPYESCRTHRDAAGERVTPEVKVASEDVLRRIGLNMTEAMELFLRRVIVDQKLPFEVVALDDTLLATTVRAAEPSIQTDEVHTGARRARRGQ